MSGLPEDSWLFNFGPAKVYGHSVLYKTNKSVVFVNKKPVVPGHLLICPLRYLFILSTVFVRIRSKVAEIANQIYSSSVAKSVSSPEITTKASVSARNENCTKNVQEVLSNFQVFSL